MQRQGAAAIPAAFPPLSAPRTASYAQGSVRLQQAGGGVSEPSHGCWTGVEPEGVAGVIAALRSLAPAPPPPTPTTRPLLHPGAAAPPAPAAAAAAVGRT